MPIPPGYEVTWGGEFENQQRAMARLRIVIPLALAITFLLLFSAFNSVFDATLIMLNVPFALVGGIFALGAADMPLSVSAAVGFIALLGQAVLKRRARGGRDPQSARERRAVARRSRAGHARIACARC